MRVAVWLLISAGALGCKDESCRYTLPPQEVLGACNAILGYAWIGGECLAVSGCSCTSPDCEPMPFASEPECLETCASGGT